MGVVFFPELFPFVIEFIRKTLDKKYPEDKFLSLTCQGVLIRIIPSIYPGCIFIPDVPGRPWFIERGHPWGPPSAGITLMPRVIIQRKFTVFYPALTSPAAGGTQRRPPLNP